MTHIEGFPLPATARHDEHGNHIPPRILDWRITSDPSSPFYDPDRPVRGSEVERDQRQKSAFAKHLAEHRRRGESDTIIEGI